MKVSVRLYAQLRDVTGASSIDIDLSEGATISDLLGELYARFPPLKSHDKTILIGVGVEFVDRNYEIRLGDEIAIMPPVQGG